MHAGETGLGKSTVVNSLFLTDLYSNRVIPNVAGTYTVYIYIYIYIPFHPDVARYKVQGCEGFALAVNHTGAIRCGGCVSDRQQCSCRL